MAAESPKQIESPCVDICQLDDNDNFCIGCFRTVEEIAHWTEFDEATRQTIIAELEKRREQFEKSS